MVRETRHLWVGNLPDNIREERILEHFKRYGKVQSVKILSKKDEEACNGVGANNVSGGGVGTCATVAFIDIKSAAKAHNADNKIEERTLKTDYYEPPVNSTATSAIFIHERDDSLGRPAGAPYSSNRQSRYPIGLQDDRNYDRSGYYYDRATPGERDTYVRRSLGLGYHDDEAYPPVSRGRSRDRYIRTATAGGGGASAYQDANERNQNHFGGHRNRQHFDQQRYPSSGGSEQYSGSAAGEERDNSGTRNGGATVASATSRRPSVTVPTVTSTVTSPPHNNNGSAGSNAPVSANVTSSNGGTTGTRQQRRTKKASASRSRSRSRSNSHSRSRSSSRSSNGSNRSSSVSSKLRSSSSNSSSRSRSPSKSRSPAASHCSQSSEKSGRVGDRPASAITGPVPSSVPFIQSAVTTPSGTMVSSSCGSAGGNVMVASQVTLPPNSGVVILASSLSDGNCCDKDDKRPLGICVRNLPVRSTDTSLKDGLFHEYKKHGKVTMVKVIGQGIDRYAVVCFKKPEDVEKALEVSKDKLFFGCKIEVTAHEGLDGEDNEFRPLEADLDEFHPKATRTLFIGNLEKDITTTELRKHFDQFGEIIEIDIKKQGSASSYAFIQYSDIGSVVKAMRKLDGENLGSNRIKLGFGKSMPTNCVWLDGVTDGVLEKFLARHFNRFGPVNYTAIDRERGHALVFYDTTEFAQIAVSEMRGRVLGGKRLQVDYASRECQQVFFEKLELSGQLIPSGSERPWERTRERRDFEVIRDERPIQEPEIAKPKPQTREARVGFENRTYPRYENPPRPNSRGSFRGTVQRGTFNARGRGTQSFPTRYELYHDEFVERRISRNYDEEFSQGSGASFEDSYEQELREYGYSQRERREYVGGEDRVLERNARGRSFSPLRRRDSASVSPNSRERHKDDRSGSPTLRENRSNSLRMGEKHEDHYGSKERYLRSDELEDIEDGKERIKSETLERLSRKRNKHSSSLNLTLENDDHHSQSPNRSRHQSRSQSPAFLGKERKNSKELQHERNHGSHLKSPNNSQGSSRVSSPSRENDITDTLMDYTDHKELTNRRKLSVDGKFDLRDSLMQGSSHPGLKSGDGVVLHGKCDSDAVKRKSAERQEALDARHPDSLVSFCGLSERKKRLLAMSGTPLVRSDYHGKNKSSECLSARSSIDSKNECELNEDKHLRLVDSRKKHGHIFHLLDHLAERSSSAKCSSLVDNCIDSEKPSHKKAKILVRDLSPPLEAPTKELAVLSGKDSKELPHQRHLIPVIELDHGSDYAIINSKPNLRKTVSDPRNKSSDLHHSHFASQRLKKMNDLDDATGIDLPQDHDGLLTSNWRKSSLQHPAFRRDETEVNRDKLSIPPFGVQLANEVSSTSDSIPHSRHGKSRSLLESMHDSKKERDSSPLSLPLPKFAATLRTPKASPNPLSSPTPSSVSPNETTSPKNIFAPSKLTLGTPSLEEKRAEKVVELPVPIEEVNSVEVEPKTEPLVITTDFKDNDPVVSEISSPLLSPTDKILVKDVEESCSSSEEPIDTNRPSIEERIRALDEKYNAWSGSTRSFSSSLSGDSPTTPAVTIDYQKYNIKRRPRYSFLTNDVKPEPSEIMKSLLAKSTIFDQDSKRLQHINEKYEPKEVKIETSVKTRPSFRTKAEAKEFSLPIQLNTFVNNIVVPASNVNSNAVGILPSSQCSPVASTHTVITPQGIKNTVDSIPSLKPMSTPEKLLLSALPLTKVMEPCKPVSCLKELKSSPQAISCKLTVDVDNCTSADLPISPNAAIKKEALSPVKTEAVALIDPRKEVRERTSGSAILNCSVPIKESNLKKESPEREHSKKEVNHQSSKDTSRKDRDSTKESSHRKDHNRNSNGKKEELSSTKESTSSAGNGGSHRRDSISDTTTKELKENKKEGAHNSNNETLSNHVSNSLKRRLTSLDSSESDSGKSTEQSFHERDSRRRKETHLETKTFEPESKKSRMVNSIKEVEKLRECSLSPPPLTKKPTESKKERSNSGKSEKSSKSSKYESSYEKEDALKTCEQKSKSKHESSRSKDEKRNKSKEGREKNEHSNRSSEKSSSKTKYNSENKSSEKDSRSTGSHSSSNNSKSSSSKKESSHGSERDKHKGDKKSNSNSGEKPKENSGSSKSKNNKKRSKQKLNFWEDEPVYFSMYDKVKARSSKTQTIKEKQKDLESVRQKFNQLKQSRAKREEKSKSMDSDRDSDMLISPHSSESDGNKSKSSPPLNKTKQLKKKKLVIESSSDEENRQPPMDIFFDDTSSKLDKEHSSNSDSDSELDFCKLAAGSKNKTKKLDIYDLDSSDQEEPTRLKYIGRKKISRPKSSLESTQNQRPKVIKSDFESSDNEMYALKSLTSTTTLVKKKEHKKKKSSRKEKQTEMKSDYELSEDDSVSKKESIQIQKKSSKPARETISIKEERTGSQHSEKLFSQSQEMKIEKNSSEVDSKSHKSSESKDAKDSLMKSKNINAKKKKKSKKTSKVKDKKSHAKSGQDQDEGKKPEIDKLSQIDDDDDEDDEDASRQKSLSPPRLQNNLLSENEEFKSDFSDYEYEHQRSTEKEHCGSFWPGTDMKVDFDAETSRCDSSSVLSLSKGKKAANHSLMNSENLSENERPFSEEEYHQSPTKKQSTESIDKYSPVRDTTSSDEGNNRLFEDNSCMNDLENSDRDSISELKINKQEEEKRKKKKVIKDKKKKPKEAPVLMQPKEIAPVDPEPICSPNFFDKILSPNDDGSKLSEDLRLDEEIAEEARRLEEELLAASEETSTFGDSESVSKKESKHQERRFEEEAAKETRRLEEELFMSTQHHWHLKDDDKNYAEESQSVPVLLEENPPKEAKCEEKIQNIIKETIYTGLDMESPLPVEGNQPNPIDFIIGNNEVQDPFKMGKEGSPYEIDNERKIEDDLAVCALLQEMNNDIPPDLPKVTEFLDSMMDQHTEEDTDAVNYLLEQQSEPLGEPESVPELSPENLEDFKSHHGPNIFEDLEENPFASEPISLPNQSDVPNFENVQSEKTRRASSEVDAETELASNFIMPKEDRTSMENIEEPERPNSSTIINEKLDDEEETVPEPVPVHAKESEVTEEVADNAPPSPAEQLESISHSPEVSQPENIPELSVPELPAAELPAAELPAAELPATELPATELPATELPAAEFPAAKLPAAELPAAELPAAELPAAELPAAELPAVELPAVELPAVELPAAELPAAELPAAELPAAELPAPELPVAELPVPELPAAELPVPELPAAELPAAELPVPELSVPELPVPELPVPELSVPELPVPELSVPELPVPELPVPEPPVQELSIPELPVSNLSSNEMDGESDMTKSECKKQKKKKRKDSKGKRDSKDEFDASQLEIQKDLADSFLNLSELSNTNITPSIPPVLEVEKPKDISHPLNLLSQHGDYGNDLHAKIHKDPFRPTLFKDKIFKEQLLESLSNTRQVHHFKENTFKEVIEPFMKKEELFKKELDFPKTDSGIEISDFTKDTDLASNSSPLADHASEETEVEQDDTKDYQNDDYYNSPKYMQRLEQSENKNEKSDLSNCPKVTILDLKNVSDDKEERKVEESENTEQVLNENELPSPTLETDDTLIQRPLEELTKQNKIPTCESLIETNVINTHVEENKKPERPRRGRKPKNRKYSESSICDLGVNEPAPATPQRTSSRRARQTAPERCRRSLRSDPYALLSPPELSNHGSNDEPGSDKLEDFNDELGAPKSETVSSPSDKNEETILDSSHHEETSNDHSNVDGNVLKEEPKKRRGRKKKMSGEHHQNYLSSPPPLEKPEAKVEDSDPGKENHRGKESRLWLSISAAEKTTEPKVATIKSSSSVYDVFEFRDSEDEELTFERDLQSTNKERVIETRTTSHITDSKHSELKQETKTTEPLQLNPVSHEKQKIHEDTKNKMPEDTKNKMQEEAKNKMDEDTKNKMDQETKNKMDEDTKNKMDQDTKNKMDEDTKNKMHEDTKSRIPKDGKHNIHEDTKNKIHEDLKNKHEGKHRLREDSILKAHEEDKFETPEEDKFKTHDEGKLKTHDEGKLKTHEEGKLKTHEEGKLKTHEEDKLKTHEEGKLKNHDDGKHKSHDDGKHKSHEEGKHKSHEEGKHKSHEEGKHKSHEEGKHKSHEEGKHKSHEEGKHKSHEEGKHKSHEEGKHKSHDEGKHRSHDEGKHKSHDEGKHKSHEDGKHKSHEDGKHKNHEDGKHKSHEDGKHKSHEDGKHKSLEDGKHNKVHDESKHNKVHDESKHNKVHDESKHKGHEENKHKAHEEKDGGPKEYVTELSQHGKISITIRLHQRDGTDGNGASMAEVVKTSEAVSEETRADGLRVEKKQEITSLPEPLPATNVRQTRKSSRLTAQINKTTVDEVIEDVVKGNFKSTEGITSLLEVTPARATRRTRASRRSEEALARLGEDSSCDAQDNSKNKNEPIFIIPDNKVKDQPLDVGKPLSFHSPPVILPTTCEPGPVDNETPKSETKISLRYYRIARANARAENQPKDDSNAIQGPTRTTSSEDVTQTPPTIIENSHLTCPSLPVMKVELPSITPNPTPVLRTKSKEGEKTGDGDEDSDSRSSPTVLIDPVTGFLTPVNKKGEIRPSTSMSQDLLKSISNANTTNTHTNAVVSTPTPVLSESPSVITKNSNIVMNSSAPSSIVSTPTTVSTITTVANNSSITSITSQSITIKIPVTSQKQSVVVEPHQSPKLSLPSVISSATVSVPSPAATKGVKAPVKEISSYSINSTLPPPITVLTSSITTAASVVSSPTFADAKHCIVPRTFTENAIPKPSKELIAKIMGESRELQPPVSQVSQVLRNQGSRVVVTTGHSLPPPLVQSQTTVAPAHTTQAAVTSTPSVQVGGKPQTPIGHTSVPIAQSVPGWPQAVSYQTAFPPQITNTTSHTKVGKQTPPAQTVVSYSGVRTVPSIPPVPTISSHSCRGVTSTIDSSARTSGIQHHMPTTTPSSHLSNISARTETNVITSGVSSKEAFQNMPKPPAAHSGSSISHLHPPVSETRPITPGEAAAPIIQSGLSRNTSRTPPTASNRGLPGFQPEGNNHHITHQLSANPNTIRELQSIHASKHTSSSSADGRTSHLVPNMVKASHQQVSKLSPTFLAQAGFALPGFDPAAVHANAQGNPASGVIAELLQNPHFFQQHHKEIMAQFNERVASQMVRPSTPSSSSGHPEINRLGNPTPPHTPTPPVTTATHVLQPSDIHPAHMAAASLHMRHLSQSPLLVPHHGMHPTDLNAYVHQQMLYAATHPHYPMHPELRAQQEAQARAAALGIARFGYPAMAPAGTPPMNFRQPAEPRLPHPSSAETKSDLKPSVEPAKVPADRLAEGLHHHHHHHHHESSKVKSETETKSNSECKRNEDVERERHHSGHSDSKHGPGPPPPLSTNPLRPHVPYPTPVRQLSPHLSVSPHERITDSPAVANLYAQNQIRAGHHLPAEHKVDLSRQPAPNPLQLATVKQQHEQEPEIKPPAAHQNPPSTIPMYPFEPNSHKPMGMDRGPPPNAGVLALKKDSNGSSLPVPQLNFPPPHGELHHLPESIASGHSKHHLSKEGYNRIAQAQASMNLSNQHGSVLPGLQSVGFPGMPSSLAVGDNSQRRGSVPTPQTGSEAPIHQPSPARAILQPSGVTRTQPQTPPHASQVPAQGDSFLLQRYPVMWQGLLALKNDQAAVQMHFVSGNPRIAQHSLPAMSDSGTAPVRIAQRMRLEQTQVEGVARKMQMLDEHCILLALPCGRDHMDVLQQSNNLKNGLINYLQLKQAAGIVNAAAPGSQQPAYVIHVFPSCEFSDENMTRIAPDLLHSVSDIAHLLIIITTV